MLLNQILMCSGNYLPIAEATVVKEGVCLATQLGLEPRPLHLVCAGCHQGWV